MKDYNAGNPTFHDTIQITEPTDPNHADNINKAPTQIFENTLVNKKSIDAMKEGGGSAGGFATLGDDGKIEPDQLDISNQKVTFSQAAARAGITADDTLSTAFGKLAKYCADLEAGAASTLLGANLTANTALISNASGKVATSSTTATELGYVHGVTSGIQAQLNGKCANNDSRLTNARTPTSHTHTIAQVTNLQTTLNGKAPTSHTHTIAQVTNLQNQLNAKAAASTVNSLQATVNKLNTDLTKNGKIGTIDGKQFLRFRWNLTRNGLVVSINDNNYALFRPDSWISNWNEA